jgi:hypothetical protein
VRFGPSKRIRRVKKKKKNRKDCCAVLIWRADLAGIFIVGGGGVWGLGV